MSGRRVLVFTASGTFRGTPGEVVKPMRGGSLVRVEGERCEMYFTDREIIPASERFIEPMVAGG